MKTNVNKFQKLPLGDRVKETTLIPEFKKNTDAFTGAVARFRSDPLQTLIKSLIMQMTCKFNPLFLKVIKKRRGSKTKKLISSTQNRGFHRTAQFQFPP